VFLKEFSTFTYRNQLSIHMSRELPDNLVAIGVNRVFLPHAIFFWKVAVKTLGSLYFDLSADLIHIKTKSRVQAMHSSFCPVEGYGRHEERYI